MIVVVSLLVCLIARPLPRLAVDAVVMAMAVVLIHRRRHCERALFSGEAVATRPRVATMSPRKAMQRHLTISLRLTELRSLFPASVARAEALFGQRACWSPSAHYGCGR